MKPVPLTRREGSVQPPNWEMLDQWIQNKRDNEAADKRRKAAARAKLAANPLTLAEFQGVWEQCEEWGECDAYGGEECMRVLYEWVEQGFPRPVCEFIARRAKIGPTGEEGEK